MIVRFQRVLPIQTALPQGSLSEPLLFLIYIKNLTDNLNSNVKLLADDNSLFLEICDPLEAANVLNNDLRVMGRTMENGF